MSSTTPRSVRIPFKVPGDVKKWRVRIQNFNFRLHVAYPGPVTIRTLNVGTGGIDEAGNPTSAFVPSIDFPQGIQTLLRDEVIRSLGEGWASNWHEIPLRADLSYLLTFGYRTNRQPVHISMGGGWQTNGNPFNAELTEDPTAAPSKRLPFDVRLELVTVDRLGQNVVIGDSISAASGATLPIFEAPVAIEGRRKKRVTRLHTFRESSFGEWVGGSWSDSRSPSWQEILEYGPAERVIIALGNNDIHAGDPLPKLNERIEKVTKLVRERIAPNVVVCTVTPRLSWTRTDKEVVRRRFNKWMRTGPLGVSGVLKMARTVEDTRPRGTHPNYDFSTPTAFTSIPGGLRNLPRPWPPHSSLPTKALWCQRCSLYVWQ